MPIIDAQYNDTVAIEVHGGASRFFDLGFGAIGAEGSLRAIGRLRAVVGADVWLARRVLPPNVALDRGVYDVWDAVVPVYAGLVVRIGGEGIRGQVGADLIVADYTRNSPLAVGGRVRAGLAVPVSPHLALVSDLAVGAWYGSAWSEVAAGVQDVGPLAQWTAGVAFGR